MHELTCNFTLCSLISAFSSLSPSLPYQSHRCQLVASVRSAKSARSASASSLPIRLSRTCYHAFRCSFRGMRFFAVRASSLCSRPEHSRLYQSEHPHGICQLQAMLSALHRQDRRWQDSVQLSGPKLHRRRQWRKRARRCSGLVATSLRRCMANTDDSLALVGTGEGTTIEVAIFDPTDAAYKDNGAGVLSQDVKQLLVPNPLSGPGIVSSMTSIPTPGRD